MTYEDTLRTVQRLRPGDKIEVKHEVKVGFRKWMTTTTGEVVRMERRRHGLHFMRNHDDKVFSDSIVLRKDDGELTTVTVDDFSEIRVLKGASRE
jgi:ribosomal protein L34